MPPAPTIRMFFIWVVLVEVIREVILCFGVCIIMIGNIKIFLDIVGIYTNH